MKRYRYLIVGGGMTADSAVHGIREVDPDGNIGLFSLEPDPPYKRPPLSKGLWKGKPLDSIWRKTTGPGVDLYLSRRVQSIAPGNKTITDEQGTVYAYEKLLLATGGTVRRLSYGGDQVIYYRTLEDYRRLLERAKIGNRFAVIGGGFIGSEIAAALAMTGKEVSMVFPDAGIGARVFPNDLSQFITGYYRQKGVVVLSGEAATGMENPGNQQALITRDRGQILVDGVIAGIGITPEVSLASAAGLQVGNGIVVNETLATSQPDIFSAGDVAEFYNPTLAKRMRVEHEDNANAMGKAAGRNMAGAHESYDYLPYFYSDLFELGYEAIGEVDSRLETVSDWKEPFRQGVIYYLNGGRVRGVLLWNVWGQVNAARSLIAEPGPYQPGDLKGCLPA